MKMEIVNPDNIKKVDIVIGIPSYNEADNIAFVVKQVSKGLTKYYPHLKGVVIDVDNNSPDGTKQVFLNAKSDVPKIYASTPEGIAGKGYNFENLFLLVKELDAQLVVVVDADLRSITPEWVKYFIDPILEEGYEYVTPVYSRHKYDGTITNNICYPLTYSLFGQNIRQPIGGDFAFNRTLCLYWLDQKWNTAIRQYGIDIFQSSHAVMGGFKVCQTGLGSKVHKPSAPKLGPMFVQVVQSLFEVIVTNQKKWSEVAEIVEVPQFGLQKKGRAQSLTVDVEKIRQQALDGFAKDGAEVKKYLTAENFALIEPMFKEQKLAISAELWIKMVYDMIAAFSTLKTDAAKEQLAEAMKPLYFARVTTIIKKTLSWSTPKTEIEFLAQAKLFFEMRPYLLQRLKEISN